MTDAVRLAIRERLERVRGERKKGHLQEAEKEVRRKADMLAALREISAQTAELLKGPPLDHAELFEPLLFKRDDFRKTDVIPAIA